MLILIILSFIKLVIMIKAHFKKNLFLQTHHFLFDFKK